MNGQDYLWDRSGKPDPEIQHLENLLGEFRHRPRRPRRYWPAAIAAAIALTVGLAAYWYTRPAWEVQGSRAQSVLRQGRWLVTDSQSGVRLNVTDVGHIEVEPNSRVRLVRSRRGDHRLALQQGTIHAFIWAPPGDFAVETPSALTIDLGCAYDLTVRPDGEGLVEVTTGWVAFEGAGKLSLIPAGAACITRLRQGPGTPYYRDASNTFQQAIGQFDLHGSLAPVLREARPRDAFTLWHVLRRVPSSERGLVYDRLVRLLPAPATVTRTGVLSGDPKMFAELWNALGLGDQQWWERWKQKLPLER